MTQTVSRALSRRTADHGRDPGGTQTLLRLFLAISAVALVPLGFWAMLDETSRGAMVFVGVLCLLAIGFPLFVRGQALNPLEPIVLCMVAVAIGCTFRAVYIGFSDYYRSDFLTFGLTYSQIATGGIWVALALACLSAGYLLTTGKVDLSRTGVMLREVRIDGRFWIVTLVGIVLAAVSTYVFFRLFDIGLSLEAISQKRQLATGLGSGEDTSSSLGPVRLLSGFAESCLYVLVAVKLFRRERLGGAYIFLAVLLFAASAVVPFITSSRSSLGTILINCLALVYLAGRLRVRVLVVSGLLIVFAVTFMGNLRSQGREADAGAGAVDAIIGSGNFVDLARTTAIDDRTPDVVPFRNGATYAALLTAPVPSSVWANKPPVSLGPWIKSQVFGQRTIASGWPPGILGEAAVNFGTAGMLAVAFVFGALIRFVFNSFEPLIRNNASAAVLYVSIFYPLGIQFIGLSFAHGVMTILQSLVPALVVLYLVSRKTRSPGAGVVVPAGRAT